MNFLINFHSRLGRWFTLWQKKMSNFAEGFWYIMRKFCVRINILVIMGCFLSSCSPFRVIDLLVDSNGYTVEREQSYGDGPAMRMDIYSPKNHGNLNEDIIMFVYGGSWRSGRLFSGKKEYYRFVGKLFSSEGFTTIIPDYRVYPEVRFPSFVEDVAKAVKWIHTNMNLNNDNRRLILVGHSAGAHIVSLLALDPNYFNEIGIDRSVLRGWVGLSGPYNFNPLAIRYIRPIFESVINDIDKARPISFASFKASPGMLIHGKRDRLVSASNSLALYKSLSGVGSKIEYLAVDAGHFDTVLGLGVPFIGKSEVQAAIFKFLRSLD